MIAAPFPQNEEDRLNALYRYGVLDTAAENAFDDLTRLAGRLFDVPMALVSLVDVNRQWFKSSFGLDACETPRDLAFCAHALLQPEDILEITDPLNDPRFADNPLVTGDPHIRFYAGAPLLTADGQPLGTFCLIDRRTRLPLDASGRDNLKILARAAIAILELRLERLDRAIAAKAVNDMEALASERLGHLAHELKTPLNAVLGYSQLARAQVSNAGTLDTSRTETYVERIETAGQHMLELVDSLLAPLRRQQAEAMGPDLSATDLSALLDDVVALTSPLVRRSGMILKMTVGDNLPFPQADALRLRQILINFITNATKYAGTGTIHVDAKPLEETALRISVRDEGPGIAPEDQPYLFDKGYRTSDAIGKEGFGSGLALSRLAAQTMRGSVGVDSAPGQGATFWVELPVA